jgi:hypothetical protein
MNNLKIRTNATIGNEIELTLDRDIKNDDIENNPIVVKNETTGEPVKIALHQLESSPGVVKIVFKEIVPSGWYDIEIPSVLIRGQQRDLLSDVTILGVLKVST